MSDLGTFQEALKGALRAEVVEQCVLDDATVNLLVQTAFTARMELVRSPRAAEMTALAVAAARVGTRSTKPRVVLRKLIDYAQSEFGWVPTARVLEAAGKRVT